MSMGPDIDTRQQKHPEYTFPLSPPSSTNVTAQSSPRLNPHDPPIVGQFLTRPPVFRRANSYTVKSWSQKTVNGDDTDSDESVKASRQGRTSPQSSSLSRLAHKKSNGPLTVPATRTSFDRTQLTSPPKATRPTYRRSSCASSSAIDIVVPPSPPANAGIGRKVTASLQLFKDTAPGSFLEDPKVRESSKAEGRHMAGSSHKGDEVAEAQFLKRSEWPDRGSAFRRERSSTGVSSVRGRDSTSVCAGVEDVEASRGKDRNPSIRDINDLTQWRKDVVTRQDIGRGRRVERAADGTGFDHEVGLRGSALPIIPASLPCDAPELSVPPSPFARSQSRAYPPSPSPSRSPLDRIPPASLPNLPTKLPPISPAYCASDPEASSTDNDTRSHSRSPTPIQTLSSTPVPPCQPISLKLPSPKVSPSEPMSYSPSSTDDESGWESASVTTSTTSATSLVSPSPPQTQPPHLNFPSDEDDEERQQRSLLNSPVGGSGSGSDRNVLDNSGDLDLDLDFSQASLPHIPLRPFRNQVGGHSAIYKFTKGAVCKPLVSRENLFYESVEREAPPLLGFIPRYLGVMLVSYRRVPKGSITPPVTNDLSTTPKPGDLEAQPPRPPLHKSATASPRVPEYSHAHLTNADMPDSVIEENEGGDTDPAEAEMPEVALDHNRHIIPEWMLRGGQRNRSLSSSSYASGVSQLRHLKRMGGAMASTPDLALPVNRRTSSTGTTSTIKSTRLARQFTAAHVVGAPTPANSPSASMRILPDAKKPSSRQFFLHSTSDDDEGTRSRPVQPSPPEQNIRTSQSPVWFGGTGSTVVNTKLKDHVFSTVLRRLRKHTGTRCTGVRTEDEGEVADAEGDDTCAGDRASRSRRKKKIINQVDRLKEEDEEDADSPGIRRVQSESAVVMPATFETVDAEERRSKGVPNFYNIESDHSLGKLANGGTHIPNGVALGPSFSRRRSRSRSLDMPASHAPSAPIPIAGRDPGSPPQQPENDPTVTRQNHFILMEDLTGRMKHSCVLDLKMGTRQYGMDATYAKKKSQRKKCDRTTSRTLGVRICGMQVWNNVTQSYVTQDKYMGREVRTEEFPSVLASFLFDGERLLTYQIPVLLQKIYGLARIINRLKGYRFYGCSLLLIYDGDHESQESFRSSTMEHLSSRSKRGESLERSRSRTEGKHDKPNLRRSHSEDLLIGPIAKRSSGRRKRGEVCVRIVDFAHTTTGRDWLPYPSSLDRSAHETTGSEGYHADIDPETGLIYARFPPHFPDEPDRGFLFGLKSLSEALEKIWNKERIRRIKASRDDPSGVAYQLPPLATDGKEIFEKIFESDEDPGTLST